MKVVDPTGVVPMQRQVSDGGWHLNVSGETIGFLWNGKPNADNLFRLVEERMRDRFGVAGAIWVDKLEMAEGPALPATEAMFEKLSSGAIAVITGSGD